MKRIVSVGVAILLMTGCRLLSKHAGGSARIVPSGLALEFADGAIPVPAQLLSRLSAIGVGSIFVPISELTCRGGSVSARVVPSPEAPYALPVYLEVRGNGDFDEYLASHPDDAGEFLWSKVAPAAQASVYGHVVGVHVDWRVRRQVNAYSTALARLRQKLPPTWTLSAAVSTTVTADSRDAWSRVARVVDFLVPETFGRVTDTTEPRGFHFTADPASLATFGKPVVPDFAPQGWGVIEVAGRAPVPISDSRLNDLSEDHRLDFSFGALLTDEDEDVYVFTARESLDPAPWGGNAPAGTTVTFREHRVADLTQALAQAKFAAARILRLAALDDQDHLVGFSAIEDVMLGRSLEPEISFSRSGAAGEVSFIALNSRVEFSELSRINNWVDLRIDGGSIRDVQRGDFDRYAFLDASDQPVAAYRARKIRFFENFIAPGESMVAGPIRFSGDARFFALAHVSLPGGRILNAAEVEVAPAQTAVADTPPPSNENLPESRRRPPGRKR